MDSFNISRLPYFVAVFETGSFTAAADRLGVAKAVVSHQVAKLEEELSVSLLIRTTRKVRTTDEGERFYGRASEILRISQEAAADIRQDQEVPSGVLKITSAMDYGVRVVVPAVQAFIAAYPAMKVDLSMDDKLVDIVDGNIDVSIRVGWLKDSSAIARKIGTFRQVPVAVPSLVGTGTDQRTPKDIEKLPWIANTALSTPLQWSFSRDTRTIVINPEANVVTDLTISVHACILAGMGVAVLPDFLAEPEIKRGLLVHLCPDWTLQEGGIYAVFPPSRYRAARCNLFVETLRRAHNNIVG